ncbi:carbamoyltransferase HypF [Thiotrichales bacterium 19S11-10]|nr:carbamoyltransferase HypF [Thiotrichales bacterium 19S11-10]
MKAISLTLNGIVQGVGFRPFIYRLALKKHWCGSIQNTPMGVKLLLDSNTANALNVKNEILANLPPLARIDQFDIEEVPINKPLKGFSILDSLPGSTLTEVPEDVCICEDCLDELFDPDSRYYLYPFVSCTNCGPRYSAINQLPYDRHLTEFKKFELCLDCFRAYTDPNDRRYHAQTTVCEACGPSLSSNFNKLIDAINLGQIVALKSNSAFHLVINAHNKKAIETLRLRKHRPSKPFALMALNVASIKQWMDISKKEEQLLESNAAPIVLLKQKENSQLSSQLNPGLDSLGVMLPSTGTQYLLFYYLLGKPKGKEWLKKAADILLVVTSANISGDAVISDNGQAEDQLSEIADLIVAHNRNISMRCDDSVVKTDSISTQIIRRAKGYVPRSIKLKIKLPNVLALGSHLKNTVCFTKENKAYVSQYIGDLDSQDIVNYYQEVLIHFKKLYSIKFDCIATELHPDFYPTDLMAEMKLPIIPVQHHKAHLASVVAEHNMEGQAIGVILDGFGYGDDGTAWGGELFFCDVENQKFDRCGHLLPMTYFSQDKVQKEPWRMAIALADQFNLDDHFLLDKIPQANQFKQLLNYKANHQITTSCGRLFDAVSSLLGICHYNTYEAEAAMRLEALVEKVKIDKSLFEINEKNQLNIKQLIRACIALQASSSTKAASELFHGGFAYALASWVMQAAKKYKVNQVILNGGCFQNSVLLNEVLKLLSDNAINVYIPKELPFNDGGLSLGQAYLAAKIYKMNQLDLRK